ncbi:restriction endonuclease subunit S [Streptomyces sp. NPDC055103]
MSADVIGPGFLPLERLAEVSGGVALGGGAPGGSVELPYLRVANVQDGYIDTEDVKTVRVAVGAIERFRLARGDVLLTEGGDLDKLGRGAVWDGRVDPCLHQNHIFKVRCDRSKLLPEFLALYMASGEGKSYFLRVAKQTTNLASISSSQLKSMPIPTHPLAEQYRVVETVDAVKAQERVIEASIAKLQKLRDGLLYDAFRRNGMSASQGPSASRGEWPTAALGALCHIGSGTTPPRAAAVRYFASTGTPWVKTLDLNEGLISATDESLTAAAVDELRMRIFPAGSVLVAMYGGWEQIGRTAMLQVPAAVNQAISVLVVNGDMDPEYLLLALQHGRHRWRQFAASTRKDPNITKSDVQGFRIPVPSREEQGGIVALAAAPSRQVIFQQAELAKLRGLRQGLVDDLLSGKT